MNMDKTFSKKAMEALEKYRGLFEMFGRSKYVRYPGAAVLAEIHKVYTEDTGDESIRLNTSCQRCITELFSVVTPIFLRTQINGPQSKNSTEADKVPDSPKKTRQSRKSNKITK